MNSYIGWRKTGYSSIPIETYSARTVKLMRALMSYYYDRCTVATNTVCDATYRSHFPDEEKRCIVRVMKTAVHQLDSRGAEVADPITTLRSAGCFPPDKETDPKMLGIRSASIYCGSYQLTGSFRRRRDEGGKYCLEYMHMFTGWDDHAKDVMRNAKDLCCMLKMAIAILLSKLDRRATSLKLRNHIKMLKYVVADSSEEVLNEVTEEVTTTPGELRALADYTTLLIKKKSQANAVKAFIKTHGEAAYKSLFGEPETDEFKLASYSIIGADYEDRCTKVLGESSEIEVDAVYIQ
jgi:hypothetical protein